MLSHPKFDQVFEVEIDVCSTGIEAILVQERRLIEYFSKKLSDARQKWSTYEQELYVMLKSYNNESIILYTENLFCTMISKL